MAKTLYVMRHGHAVVRAPSDAQRPLSTRGEEEARKAAQRLQGLKPEVFLASPYLRAQQTAAIIREAAGIPTEIATEAHITPDDHPSAVAKMLSELENASEILMVSHNPLVSALVSLLVEGHFQGGYAMDTASIACLDFDEFLDVGQGTLRWLHYTD